MRESYRVKERLYSYYLFLAAVVVVVTVLMVMGTTLIVDVTDKTITDFYNRHRRTA